MLALLVSLLSLHPPPPTQGAPTTTCALPPGYTWTHQPLTNTYYTTTKTQGSWFHMVFECARIGHPATNIAHITDQQTVEFLRATNRLYSNDGEPYWIGATRIGRNRKHWVWYTYRDVRTRAVSPVRKFFWADAVTAEESKFTEGREDCMKYDVEGGSWFTDTCSRYYRALCMLQC